MNDYMIFIGLGATLTIAIATVVSVVAGGNGLHKERLTSSEIRVFWKAMFVGILAWPIAQSATKISILLFYIHLFPTKRLCIAAYTLIAVVSAWGIEHILVSLFLCRPISYNWDGSIDGHCGDVSANCLAAEGINTLTDILILILPMPTIWRLHVPLHSKFILSLIFGLGFFICIISIIRFRSLFDYTTAPMMESKVYNSDGTHDNKLQSLYTVLESSLGVICACLVFLKPILTHPKMAKSLSHKETSINTSPRNSSRTIESRGASASSEKATPQTSWLHDEQKILRSSDEKHVHPLDLETGEQYPKAEDDGQQRNKLEIRETKDIELSFE
ncbi:MAG: hypothetical protein Q9181_002881 [Wetmoreana brouardii]